ncbi:hypothetical protein L9F63_017506, partial [Diploptera punctata]
LFAHVFEPATSCSNYFTFIWCINFKIYISIIYGIFFLIIYVYFIIFIFIFCNFVLFSNFISISCFFRLCCYLFIIFPFILSCSFICFIIFNFFSAVRFRSRTPIQSSVLMWLTTFSF